MADKKGVFLFKNFFCILKNLPPDEVVRALDAFMNAVVDGEEIPESLSPMAVAIVQTMIEQSAEGEKKKVEHAKRVEAWRTKKTEKEPTEKNVTICDDHNLSHDDAVTSCDRYKNKNKSKSKNKNESNLSLSPLPPSHEVGGEAGAQPPEPPERETAAGRENEIADGFAAFWELYPRKQRQDQARKRWNQLAPGDKLIEEICQSVLRWSSSRQWTQEGNRFVPLAEKFIAQKIWMDEPDTPGTPGKSGTPDKSGTLDRPPTSFDTQEFFDAALRKSLGEEAGK